VLREKGRSRKKDVKAKKDLADAVAEVDINSSKTSPATEPAPKPQVLSEDEVKRKGKLAIEEYFVCEDLGEAVLCIKELEAPDYVWQVIVEGINIAVEKKEKEHFLFEKFIISLHKEGVATSKDITKAVHDFLEFLVDIEIDVPQAGGILAGMVAGWLHRSVLPQDIFQTAPEMFYTSGGAPKFVVAVMEALAKKEAAKEADNSLLSPTQLVQSLDFVKITQGQEDEAAEELQQRCLSAAQPLCCS